jgi:RNA polymerase sigma-32 factor
MTDDKQDPKNSLEPELVEQEASKALVKLNTDVGHYRGTDSLSAYLNEIAKYELLTLEEEQQLAAKMRDEGDIEAAKKLVQANLRLVVKIALEYRKSYSNLMDLIQEGNIGLMKAVSKYDLDKGAKLSYYASWWIKSYILKFILDNFHLVKIGTTSDQKKLFYNLVKEKNRLQGQGVNPDSKLIANNLGVSEKSVVLMEQRLSESGGEASLDASLSHNSTMTLGDKIAADESDLDDILADKQGVEILKTRLGDYISSLKERDRDIFRRRLLSEAPQSLQEIADSYGVSRERIRQIEARLIQQLKDYMHEYLDLEDLKD